MRKYLKITTIIEETDQWVAFIDDSPKPPPNRITLTYPIINNANICAFAVCGKDKADVIKVISSNYYIHIII